MKSIVISSNSSGGGKTTFTLGLMKALMNRGLRVQGYKAGPDYIDPAFHSYITAQPSRNLDMFLMGEDGVKASYSRGKGQIGIIEGVMGLYDGVGITSSNSTAELSRTLNIPVVLVISPKGQCTSLCAEIKGLMQFEKIDVVGVILNGISESYFRLLKAAIERHCGITVFGYLPYDERLNLKSRHLGLVQSSEIEDLLSKISICAELIEKHVDLRKLLESFKETKVYEDNYHLNNIGIKTAVAFDSAFSFYYRENLELLQELGEVEFFSPIKDKELPKDIDFLYLGGGYPEVFIEELSKNKSIREQIRDALISGLPCYAECGGLMYLMESIDGKDAVGFYRGKACMTGRLQNFGYAKIEVEKENKILPRGFRVNCHEFHKSMVDSDEDKIYTLCKESYEGSIKEWNCGYIKKNTLGTYAHVHFFKNMDMLNFLIKKNEVKP